MVLFASCECLDCMLKTESAGWELLRGCLISQRAILFLLGSLVNLCMAEFLKSTTVPFNVDDDSAQAGDKLSWL